MNAATNDPVDATLPQPLPKREGSRSRTMKITIAIAVLSMLATAALAADAPPPGGIKLLPGYSHTPRQGFDSIHGEISKKDGITIHYGIGRVRPPGGIGIGGDFTNAVESLPKEDVQWRKDQTVAGQPVQIALAKNNILYITFPKLGANFNVQTKTSEDIADTMLMVLTYPEAPAKKPDAPKQR